MATGGFPTALCLYISAGERTRIRWSRVEERLQTHPREASSLDAYGRFLLNAILARRMDDYPPVGIVKAFVDAYPPVVWSSANIGGIPLEVACWRRAPLNIIKLLMDSRPSMEHDYTALNVLWRAHASVFERSNMNLVDFVCDGGREGAEIWTKLYMLLRYCTDPRKNISTWRGLHLASSSPTCSLELFQLILTMLSGEEAKRANARGQLPLHCLASGADQSSWREKLDLLLEANPNAVRTPDAERLLPIHAAAIAGCPDEFMNVLFDAAPDTLCRRGGKDRLFPFQLAATSSQTSVSLVYRLLRAAPHLILEDPTVPSRSVEEVQCEQSLQYVPIPSNMSFDTYQSFIDLIDTVAHSRGSSTWTEMLELLSFHEGNSDALWTVVHSASSIMTLDPDFLVLAVRLHPEDLLEKDEYGRLPLHIVSSLDPNPLAAEEDDRESKINTILNGFPRAAKARDASGSLPLHKAIEAGHSWMSLSSLLRAAPETLCRRDGVYKLFPFQLAACSESAGLDEVYQLLVSAPDILSQQNL